MLENQTIINREIGNENTFIIQMFIIHSILYKFTSKWCWWWFLKKTERNVCAVSFEVCVSVWGCVCGCVCQMFVRSVYVCVFVCVCVCLKKKEKRSVCLSSLNERSTENGFGKQAMIVKQ